jgi:TPR repeat protein
VETAVALYRKAAKQGDLTATYKLGMLVSAERSLESPSFEFLRQAAQRGHVDAEFELGFSKTLGKAKGFTSTTKARQHACS